MQIKNSDMGNSISKYRRMRKIKQNDMAKAMGVTPSYLCKIERDSLDAPEKKKKSCAECPDFPCDKNEYVYQVNTSAKENIERMR